MKIWKSLSEWLERQHRRYRAQRWYQVFVGVLVFLVLLLVAKFMAENPYHGSDFSQWSRPVSQTDQLLR